MPQRPVLSAEQRDHVIGRLRKRIDELKSFDPASVSKRFDSPEVATIEVAIDETLAAAFGNGTVEFGRYEAAAQLDHGPVTMRWHGAPTPEDRMFRQFLDEGKRRSIGLLEQAIRSHEEEAPPASSPAAFPPRAKRPPIRKVFVVHGHDEIARKQVAAFLRRADFEPIILNEKANEGRTVIEKVIAHSDVGFAVVLLTPDDEGRVRVGGDGEALRPRARQNVLLELGYFIGSLGRKNVCAMKKGAVEIPSDWEGVINTELDPAGVWRTALLKELDAVGFDTDWKKALS
jgi:predicted nucleotide-binding protein